MTDMYTIFNMDIVNRKKKHSIENIQFGQATCDYVYLNGRTNKAIHLWYSSTPFKYAHNYDTYSAAPKCTQEYHSVWQKIVINSAHVMMYVDQWKTLHTSLATFVSSERCLAFPLLHKSMYNVQWNSIQYYTTMQLQCNAN